MIRVCRPGGRVVVLEFSLPGNRLLRGLYTWYFRNVLPRIGQLLARNSQEAYNYLPASVVGVSVRRKAGGADERVRTADGRLTRR